MVGKKDRDTNDVGVSIPTFYKCGKTGIRTLGTVARSPHFECGPIDHSGIFPPTKLVQGKRKNKFICDFSKTAA